MQDKPRNQQRLAVDLAGLVDVVSHEAFIPFLDAFWKTMAREWKGIDALRYGMASTDMAPKVLADALRGQQNGQVPVPHPAISSSFLPTTS